MKFLKKLLIIIVALAALFYFFGMPYIKEQTKKHSPEKTAVYNKDGMDLTVKYSSPSKKGRVIFGELVPYDKVWRTGANEPTTFTTGVEINIMGKKLPAGTYSLWTIPNKNMWKVIFNKEVPEWGVTLLSGGGKTTRDIAKDALEVEVATNNLLPAQESFKIEFIATEQLHMSLSWDSIIIMVPIKK